ncbi:hypothetical protein ABFX02_06G136800 [Erythranthe guttata]
MSVRQLDLKHLKFMFPGKAVAEALNESRNLSVGEFLSTIGRLQAEQQKQVREFKDENAWKMNKCEACVCAKRKEEGSDLRDQMVTTSGVFGYV